MVGEYAIHITCDEEDIVNSPYIAQIIPDKGGFDASKVNKFDHSECALKGLVRQTHKA